MVEILPDHGHCLVCDDPIDEGQEFCSDRCKEKFSNDLKWEKRRNLFFMTMVIILLVAFSIAALFLS